jgi:hypothetical protein
MLPNEGRRIVRVIHRHLCQIALNAPMSLDKSCVSQIDKNSNEASQAPVLQGSA